ncbi:3-hydroxyacyl-ACP dehydratase [Chitinophaga caeni]|uniref:3-hydroxyacyl-ACP dehydratase n=1 Tax=Chitinophaga caeni TaxID=2029983 RepID=A0A291QUP0_9BACT|nr:3-hydroxyacyl-ACP dehydratase [Chitinophaga caeni]ATL47602.1 3-hydroxyacyl-ACP dehydratase [Chitinophaga caeni]
MLANNFYTVQSSDQVSETQIQYKIHINGAHPIFEGHFPEQPVVPGVCMMQTITELAGQSVQQELILQKANTMKFVNMIDPRQQADVIVDLQWSQLEDQLLKVNATIKSDTITFMKLQGVFARK